MGQTVDSRQTIGRDIANRATETEPWSIVLVIIAIKQRDANLFELQNVTNRPKFGFLVPKNSEGQTFGLSNGYLVKFARQK